MSVQSLILGPLVLPWVTVLVFLAWFVGSTVHDRMAARRGLPASPHPWGMALAALVAARLAFVLHYLPQYGAQPLSALDIRDGGWMPWWGWAGAALYAVALWWRDSRSRRPVALGLGSAAGVWLVGLSLLQAVQPAVPSRLPDWQGVALDARTVQLPQLQGRPLVVNLWASWCPPCRREMPALLKASAQHPQVQFLWVNQGETPEVVARFAAQHGLPSAAVVLDTASQLGSQLGHKALPTTLFFGADGRLAVVRSGELSHATLAQHLSALQSAVSP